MCRPAITAFLRTTLLLMLALGVLARPVIDQVGEMHQANHAEVAVEDHHHDGDANPDEAPGHEGYAGMHGVLHETCASGALGMLAHALTMPGPIERAVLLPGRHVRHLPDSPSPTPFRPPIA